MQSLSTYLTYKNHYKDVRPFIEAKQKEDAARKEAYKNTVLSVEDLSLAKKRGEILRRTIDELDEFSQTKTEDVETVTQTLLGESVGVLTALGGGIGWLFQNTATGEKTRKWAQKTLKLSEQSSKSVLPGVSGFLFGVVSSLPLLLPLTTIEIQTPRIARFEALKGPMSNVNDYAILTDEQEAEAKRLAKNIILPKQKSTEKGVVESINIFSEIKSYMDLITKRAFYRKDKADYEKRRIQHSIDIKNTEIQPEQLEKAQETSEIIKRLVNKIDLESQDYIERVFKILDVTSMSLWSMGVIGGIVFDKVLDILKVPQGKFKTGFTIVSALAGVVFLNSKIAEYRNKAIRIARHKKMNELIEDPTNFLASPKKLTNTSKINNPPVENKSVFGFIKEFKQDIKDYAQYTQTTMLDNKKFKLAARNINLSQEQIKDAKQRRMDIFNTINIVDNNKKKFEETYEIFVTLLSSPLGLAATALGNAGAWLVHNLKKAPESHFKYYSIAGTLTSLMPAIGIELYTTIETRKAARVAYMTAQKQLDNKEVFVDLPKSKIDENQFLKLSFRKK